MHVIPDDELGSGITPVVGRGRFGVVVKGDWKGRAVAIKSGVDEGEIAVHTAVPRHPHVVEALGVCSSAADGQRRLVMELCHGGTVSNFAESSPVSGQGKGYYVVFGAGWVVVGVGCIGSDRLPTIMCAAVL